MNTLSIGLFRLSSLCKGAYFVKVDPLLPTTTVSP